MIPAIGPESAVSFVLAVFVLAAFVLAGFVLAVFVLAVSVLRISVLAVFVLVDFVVAPCYGSLYFFASLKNRFFRLFVNLL